MLFFLLALFSKTVSGSLPAALLLLRWWQTGRINRRDVVQLLPFFALGGDAALLVSIAATALTLFGVGAAISLFTGRSALRDGLRMLSIGAAAGALTYTIGKLLGVSLT